MGKFSRSIKAVPKVRNHAAAKSAKVAIRENVLAEIGEPARVFDAFAGSGEMWHAVWHRASVYVGCDVEWFRDERTAFVADNRRVLRAIDLAPFNVFDLDAYGSPWEQAIIVAARREVARDERIGVVLAEGSSLKLKPGGLPNALAELAGLRGKVSGLARGQQEVVDRAILGLAKRMNARVERRWEAKGRTGAQVRYIGLVLRGLA